MDKDNPGFAGGTVKDAADYVKLKVDSIKLGLLEGLSKLFSTVFSVFVFIILIHIGALFFAAAATWWLSILMDSFTSAAMIIGGIFLIIGVIIFALRRKLLVNPAIRMLGKLMADMEKHDHDDE